VPTLGLDHDEFLDSDHGFEVRVVGSGSTFPHAGFLIQNLSTTHRGDVARTHGRAGPAISGRGVGSSCQPPDWLVAIDLVRPAEPVVPGGL
jgi:hypothetical protein